MKITLLLPIFCLLSLVWSCQPTLEDRIQKQMIKYPVSQEQIEQNRMLQYAINNKLDVKETRSGMYYVIMKEGNGAQLLRGQAAEITAHYTGKLALNNEVFDSSKDKNVPLNVDLSKLIQGWQEAIPLLDKGGRGTFLIPSRLAYGDEQVGNIPPNSVLVFDIELLDFKRKS